MFKSVIRLLSVSSAVSVSAILFAGSAWAQEAVSETLQPVTEHAEHVEGGLPQLDASTFPNQLFWLVVTGVLLYLLMSKLALPRVQQVMRARDEFVHDNLRRAAALRLKSEDAKVNYDLTIQQAETRAKEFLADTVADMKQKHEQATQSVLKDIAARTQAAEQQIMAEKDKTMATLDDNAKRLADDILLSVFEIKPIAL